LRLSNQHKIVSIGILLGLNVNNDGVCGISYFEVIEIVYGIKPYPSLLGLDWDFDNQMLIHMKKRQIIFEERD
jgi:hypothetical protein